MSADAEEGKGVTSQMSDFHDGLSTCNAKRAYGRYLTQGDPFGYDAVSEWVDAINESVPNMAGRTQGNA